MQIQFAGAGIWSWGLGLSLPGIKFKCNLKFFFFLPGTLAEELSNKNNQRRDVTVNTQAGSRVFTFAPMCRMVIPFSCVTLAWQVPRGFPLLHSFSDRTDLRRNGTWQVKVKVRKTVQCKNCPKKITELLQQTRMEFIHCFYSKLKGLLSQNLDKWVTDKHRKN